jgi:hypothetical protein
MLCEIKDYKVLKLPPKGKPNSRYYVPNGEGTDIDEYVTDKDGKYHKVNPQSSSSLALKVQYPAGAIINGGKAVMIDTDGKIYPFDISDPYHYDKYLGIAQTSTIVDDLCTVVITGKVTALGQSWVAGTPYYIASTSFLSSTPPVSGFTKQVGIGVDVDTIIILGGVEFIVI